MHANKQKGKKESTCKPHVQPSGSPVMFPSLFFALYFYSLILTIKKQERNVIFFLPLQDKR